MNTKILQINMVAAMVMGNVITSANGSGRSFPRNREASWNDHLLGQRNAGMDLFCKLYKEELVDGSEPDGVRSCINKLCRVVDCPRSAISVCRLWTEGGLWENERLRLGNTLSAIAALARSKCGGGYSLSLKDFITKTPSMDTKFDWGRDQDRGSGVEVCYTNEHDLKHGDGYTSFGEIALAAKIPVFVIDIYKGNFLGEHLGGFKNFLEQLIVYNGVTCTTSPAGFFFDDNIQWLLKSWFPFLQIGLAWFFIVFRGDVYAIYPESGRVCRRGRVAPGKP